MRMADQVEVAKDALAVEFGRRGGKACMAKMTPEQRRESARRAARARWKRKGGGDGGGGNGGGGLHATIGGAVDYQPDGSAEDHSRYSVKSPSHRKAARSTSNSRIPEAAGDKLAA